jgi:hypothetical protein
MTDEILTNWKTQTFFHGTRLDAAEAIFREGFRVWDISMSLDGHVAAATLGLEST